MLVVTVHCGVSTATYSSSISDTNIINNESREQVKCSNDVYSRLLHKAARNLFFDNFTKNSRVDAPTAQNDDDSFAA